ncbi:DEKNAAC101617 [Brettanomyces naardenensis]|uniref:DEKNAAC101617 n=1 Tax=Brettanomyces naardenensis TaxID=13370 RepID=A0A448YIE2_BRENA|nr:DEKNAAC101617 [Brettanomyces naardenensis]
MKPIEDANSRGVFDVSPEVSTQIYGEAKDIVRDTSDISSSNELNMGEKYQGKHDMDIETDTHISFTRTRRVSIQVRNLSIGSRLSSGSFSFGQRALKWLSFGHKSTAPVDIESNTSIKTILHPMSFDIPCNSMTCIIGGSGSGKTTLLNCLANRQFSKSSLFKSGDIRYNNEDNLSKIRHAYVIQQDILIPTLTCFETLIYAAELKLPKLTSKRERARLVHEIILELGLKECASTLVGNHSRKGLSGGERRRLSVALQLVSNPSLLFLDEPTTGLDSYNAYLLCLTLKRLCKRMNKTIIMSIHQPRADIFKLFDRVLILSQGNLCYGDSYDNVFSHFDSIGYPIPELKVNPADFLVDQTTVDTRTFDNEQESLKRMTEISGKWKERMKNMGQMEKVEEDDEEVAQKNVIFQEIGRAPFFREVGIHFRRNLRLQMRDPLGTASVLLEALALGLITGWIFFKPGTTPEGIRSLESSLYMSSTLMCYLYSLFEAYRLCQMDLRIFDRERMEGCISIPGFLLGRRLSKLLTEDLAIPFLYSITAYFMIGLRTDSATYFWKYFAGMLIFNLNTMAVGMLASSLSRDVSISTLICNLNFTFQTMTNGMFVNARQLPVYVRWCKYAAYQWYSFGYLISNEFTNFGSDCFSKNANNPEQQELCYTSSGAYILQQLGFWPNWNALPICVVLAFFLGAYILAGLVLYLMPVDISMGKQVKSLNNISNRENYMDVAEMGKASTNSHDGVAVKIRDINLAVSSKMGKVQKTILQNVNADFQACKLNIIMGPSGSGKTSLLNLISGRLASNLATSYLTSGQIFFNEFAVSDFSVVKPLCSYVTQEDDNLLSSLTVEETLSYAARLRLSKAKLSKKQRNEIVDRIILQMGLRDCANTLVGNQLIKGISGGEKRRLAIAIQLLSSPKILFLDEPTSGLDAFTASSIIECLDNLATHGTTVIMTIHQPRTLDQFGTIMLMAKGGRVAFDGTQDELIRHFTKMGFPVPKFTNLGDFVIDLISYNTVSQKVESRTRARVEYILDHWEDQLRIPEDTVFVDSKERLRKEFRSFVKEPASFLVGFSVLTQRQWVGLVRDKNIIIARSTQVVGMGVILALFFARLKHDLAGIQNRFGIIQQMVSLYFCGMLNNMAGYPKERDYFYDEFNDDVVSIPSFFFSYLSIEVPFEVFPCLIFTVLMVFAVGFQYQVGLFFGIFYTTVLVVNAGESLGISFNTVLDHPGFSLTIISIFCSIAVCMSGLLAMTLGSFLKAMNYLSPPHYCVMIISNLVFTKDLKFYCTPDEANADGSCSVANGHDVLVEYNLGVNMKLYFVLMAVICIIHRAISFLFLQVKLTKITIKKTHKA